jgi:molybdate/tungstate transport system substrate-binding protein
MADEEQSLGRRTVLKTTPAVVGGVVGLAGCTSPLAVGGPGSVSLLAAGSLARTFEDHVGPAFESETGTVVYGEYYGSNAIMRLVEDGTEFPDVVVSADATLLRDRLYGGFTDWDVVFAANSLGIGYREGTELGRALDRGEPWYEVALEAEPGEVAIADPDLDPLGYRAVMALELAATEHGLDGFRDAMLDRVYLEPEEPQLLAGVETGSRAAGLVYRNMALDRDLPFLEFPDAYNFARPDMANHYATVGYTTDDGYTARGRPILYNATVLEGADNPDAGRRLVGFLLDNPGLLDEAGLTVTGRLPQPGSDVPEAVGV